MYSDCIVSHNSSCISGNNPGKKRNATTEIWMQRRGPSDSNKNVYSSDNECDRARIVHSAAFRKLQNKTQIFSVDDGDFHRTRLTHSMEVAQIARGILAQLQYYPEVTHILPNVDLMDAICLAHDMGHPPFGHGGEMALNYLMREHGGFEANGQTLRCLNFLEALTAGYGLNLTRRMLLGVLKYPVEYSQIHRLKAIEIPNDELMISGDDWRPPKSYMASESNLVEWILEPFSGLEKEQFLEFTPATDETHGKSKHIGFDTSIMDLADNLSYCIHDLEDGIALNLITREHWEFVKDHLDEKWRQEMDLFDLENRLFSKNDSEKKMAISLLIRAFLKSIRLTKKDSFGSPLLSYNVKLTDEAEVFLKALKNVEFEHLIELNSVQISTYRGRQIIYKLFKAILSDPHLFLPPSFHGYYQNSSDRSQQYRVICDYLASLTDQSAYRLYERYFIPREGSIFEPF